MKLNSSSSLDTMQRVILIAADGCSLGVWVCELSDLSDFVFDLESSESLMIEDFSCLLATESEMCVREMDEADDSYKEKQPGVVSLTLFFKGL